MDVSYVREINFYIDQYLKVVKSHLILCKIKFCENGEKRKVNLSLKKIQDIKLNQ